MTATGFDRVPRPHIDLGARRDNHANTNEAVRGDADTVRFSCVVSVVQPARRALLRGAIALR